MDPEEKEPYRAERVQDGFQIVDPEGKIALVCRDQSNANHYAVLLSQAYRRGYQAGFRTARNPSAR